VTTESLPRRDVARPVLRLAFAVAWAVGALIVLAIVVSVASAASSDSDPARCSRLDDAAARLACVHALSPRDGQPAAADAAVTADRRR